MSLSNFWLQQCHYCAYMAKNMAMNANKFPLTNLSLAYIFYNFVTCKQQTILLH